MKLTMLYEYLDLVPGCYDSEPGAYCDPKGKAKVIGSGDMSHLTGGTKDRDKFLKTMSPKKKKSKKK